MDKTLNIIMEDAPMAEQYGVKFNTTPLGAFPKFKKSYSALVFNNGSFSFGDVIECILNKIGPAHGRISTWVASQIASEKVVGALSNRRLLSVQFLVDTLFVTSRCSVYKYIVKEFGAESIRTSRIHTKFCILYNDNYSVVIESTANLNKNLKLETFRVTEDTKYCEFFRNVFDQFFKIISVEENGKLSSAQKLDLIK